MKLANANEFQKKKRAVPNWRARLAWMSRLKKAKSKGAIIGVQGNMDPVMMGFVSSLATQLAALFTKTEHSHELLKNTLSALGTT